jgi:hypothetical protein
MGGKYDSGHCRCHPEPLRSAQVDLAKSRSSDPQAWREDPKVQRAHLRSGSDNPGSDRDNKAPERQDPKCERHVLNRSAPARPRDRELKSCTCGPETRARPSSVRYRQSLGRTQGPRYGCAHQDFDSNHTSSVRDHSKPGRDDPKPVTNNLPTCRNDAKSDSNHISLSATIFRANATTSTPAATPWRVNATSARGYADVIYSSATTPTAHATRFAFSQRHFVRTIRDLSVSNDIQRQRSDPKPDSNSGSPTCLGPGAASSYIYRPTAR